MDLNPEHAISDRNISVTLVGTSLGILTFLLFFLYPRASAGEVDQLSFQALITVVVLAMFSFGFSGLYTYLLAFSAKRVHRQRGNLFFSLGVSLLSLEPAFILFTLRLFVVASIAAALWIVFFAFYSYELRKNKVSIFF